MSAVRAEAAVYAIEARETIESSSGIGVGGNGASAVIERVGLPGSTATQALDGRQFWGRDQLPSLQEGALERPAEAEYSGSIDRCVPECPDSLPSQRLTTGSAGLWGDEVQKARFFGTSTVVWAPISALLASPRLAVQ